MNYWSAKQNVDSYIRTTINGDGQDPTSTANLLLELIGSEIKNVPFAPERRALIDIGCGPGYVSGKLIQEHYFNELVAIDLSEEMLNCVPWYVDIEKVRTNFQKADIGSAKFMAANASMDLAVCCRTLIYVKGIHNVLQEAARVLKPGGLFCFNCLLHTEIEEVLLCESAGAPMEVFAYSKNFLLEKMARLHFEFVNGMSSKPTNEYSAVEVKHVELLFRKR
jgi:ubiquinone/menaquinone biosynthesis C-methylase UbiE